VSTLSGPQANSTNRLRVTLKDENRQPINNATTTLTVTDPQGATVINNVSVPYVAASAGIYEYVSASTQLTQQGQYIATWNAVDGLGRTWHHVDPFRVSL
jgi:hypothetical protein